MRYLYTAVLILFCAACEDAPKKKTVRNPAQDLQDALNVYIQLCKDKGGIPILTKTTTVEFSAVWNLSKCEFPPKD